MDAPQQQLTAVQCVRGITQALRMAVLHEFFSADCCWEHFVTTQEKIRLCHKITYWNSEQVCSNKVISKFSTKTTDGPLK